MLENRKVFARHLAGGLLISPRCYPTSPTTTIRNLSRQKSGPVNWSPSPSFTTEVSLTLEAEAFEGAVIEFEHSALLLEGLNISRNALLTIFCVFLFFLLDEPLLAARANVIEYA